MTPPRALTLALLGSLAAHAAVIGWFDPDWSGDAMRPSPDAGLQVALVNPPAVATPTPRARPAPRHEPALQRAPDPRLPVTQAAQPAEPEPAPAVPRPDPIEATPPSAVTPAPVAARRPDAWLLPLARHFDYPALARRRGFEGDLRLTLQFDAEGWLHEVALAESSGNSLLDAAALASARRIGRVPELAGWRDAGTGTIELPVRYRLER